MFTYSLAWNTAFNAVPNEYAAFSPMQFCERAQKVLQAAPRARLDRIKVNCKIC